MSSPEFQPDSFDALLQRLCDERLTPDEKEELVALLHTSEAARRRYLEFVQLSISLADWSLSIFPPPQREAADEEPLLNRYVHISAGAAEAETSSALSGGTVAVTSRRKYGVAVGMVLAATLLIGLTVAVLQGRFDRQPGQVADREVPAQPVTAIDQQMFLARVVEVTPDAEWNRAEMPREFLMRVRAGDVLHLERGLAKLEFYSGARVILHGPTRFEPTGYSAAFLHSGRVSGRVDDSDFLLVTPTAEVVDLGTEFGVSVGDSADTDVLVFDGEVNVRSENADPRVVAESVNLTEGMTIRIGEDGRVAGASLLGIDAFSRRFAELAMPSGDGSELSLVDILCGGSGRGQRSAAAIDPLTGDWDRLGWQNSSSPGTRRGEVVYHPAPWHPMIDGAFIPSSTGQPTQVDSLGRTVRLPLGHGAYTWGPVWARRFTKDLEVVADRDENDFWGADTFPVITGRLADSRYGGIGIHASVGITFNLQDVRNLHAAEIDSFSAVLTNLDNAEAHNPEYAEANVRSAHFFVVIDGEIRYEQLDFRRNVEGIEFEVPIESGDQMMTLISTDANNTNKYDHIVLIDPVLNLQSADTESLISRLSP